MLDLPKGMIGKINERLDDHWADLTAKLTSKSEVDYETYFLMSSKNKKVVTRAGYYLGYLLAKEIAKTMSISEMAQMKIQDVLPLIQSTIEKLRTHRDTPDKVL